MENSSDVSVNNSTIANPEDPQVPKNEAEKQKNIELEVKFLKGKPNKT